MIRKRDLLSTHAAKVTNKYKYLLLIFNTYDDSANDMITPYVIFPLNSLKSLVPYLSEADVRTRHVCTAAIS